VVAGFGLPGVAPDLGDAGDSRAAGGRDVGPSRRAGGSRRLCAAGSPAARRARGWRHGSRSYKTLIGPSLRARTFDRQKGEAAVAVRCINRFTALGMPRSVRIA
jgi:hypothetical protein